MSLANTIRGLLSAGIVAASKAAPPTVQQSRQIQRIINSSSGLTTSPPATGIRNLIKLYETNPWVHSMINKIAQASAACDITVTKRDGEILSDHPIIDFVDAGSPYLNGFQSRTLHHAYLKLAGESFWAIGRNQFGKPASWMPIPPNWVLDVAQEPGEVFEVSTPSNGNFSVPFEDMIWFKVVNPVDPMGRGTGIIRSMARDLDIGDTAGVFVSSFLKNRARPDIIITGTAEAPLQETDVKRLEDIWVPKFQGARQAGRPLFSSNPLEFKSLDVKLRDHEMVELRRHQDTVVAEILGIPPEVFGRIENSNRATVEGADLLFNLHVVVPEVKALVAALHHRLSPEFRDLVNMKLTFVSPVAENRELALKVVVAAPHAFTVNDVRKIAGFSPLKGKEGDERPPMQTAKPDVKPGDAGTPGGQGQQQKPRGTAKPKGAEALKALVEASSESVCAAIKQNYGAEVEALAATMYEAAQVYAIAMAADLGSYTFTTDDQVLCRQVAEDMLRHIDETTCSEVETAFFKAEDDDDVPVLLAAVFRRAKSKRVPMIAETEATRIASGIAMRALMQKGLTRKVWRTVGDDRVRDAHAAMDGQIRMLSEAFTAPGNETAMAPGGFAEPSLNINCRCYVTHDPSELGGVTSTRNHNPSINGMIAVISQDVGDYLDSQLALALAAIGEDKGDDE